MGTPEQLQSLVETSVLKALNQRFDNQQPTTDKRYYTRKELATLFSCSIGTIDNWTSKRKLQSYAIGNRILYLVDEVHASLVKL
jgi:hypothetical protein